MDTAPATRRPVPLIAVLVPCAALVVVAVVMTLSSLALAGDGAYYVVRILGNDEVFGTAQRYLGNVVRQAPVLIGDQAGLTNTYALTLLFGVGQLVLPAIAWSLAILFARPDRVVFTAVVGIAGICAGTTWFNNVSESVLALPLTALVAVLLWQPTRWGWRHAVLAVAAALVLVASYEAAVVTGAVLAAWAGLRAARSKTPLERNGCAIVSGLSVISVLVAVSRAVANENPAHSRSLLYFVVELDPWELYVSLVGLAAVVAGMGPWFRWRVRSAMLLSGGTAMIVAAVSLQMSTRAAFAARGGASLAVLFLLAFMLWHWATKQPPHGEREPTGRVLAIPVVFVAAILATNLLALRDWSRSLDAFRMEVDGATGVVVAEDVLPPDRRAALWLWTAPSLSLIVRRDAGSGILADRNPTWVPFAPGDARAQLSDDYSWRR